jgi:putative tricarboxylic transport membrane protein
MSSFESLLHGFALAASPENLLAAAIGVMLGTIAGVLPGLGISGTIALLLPISFGLDPLTALVIFAGIYYGAMYGGSTTAILINVPGEGPSVVTCIEGYAMTKKGRAGAALAVAAIGSFIAGTLGLVGLTFFAPIIADSALAFGPPEYFSLAFLALVVLSGISGQSMVQSGVMVCVGMMLATVGIDPMAGIQRFTLDTDVLLAGIPFVIVVMGAYGLGEVIETVASRTTIPVPPKIPLRDMYPTRDEACRAAPAILRGSVIGFLVGLVPGPSGSISSFLSYMTERRFSRGRKEFGNGAIEGVAGPESANNGAESATLIPLLSLGLPFNSSTAMLLSGFLIHGITPGPMLVSSHPDLFWGLIASMFIGNVFLLIVNLPLIGIFVSILRIPLNILMPLVAILIVIGAYAINNSIFDVWLAVGFGFLGYVLRLAKYNIIPLVIGLFLGPLLERGLVQSMTLVDGSFLKLMERPFSGIMLGIAVLIILFKVAAGARTLFVTSAKPG